MELVRDSEFLAWAAIGGIASLPHGLPTRGNRLASIRRAPAAIYCGKRHALAILPSVAQSVSSAGGLTWASGLVTG